ncbi:hypothetical protein [Shewanella baltica]|uniref:hypothetical protein n=1 Tax=Shewanella baltica TaxID=62322 RepID=UPI000D1B621C|nr:hypothetical protein [Shewanella baltica]AVT46468.1 hypothetical protein C8I07_01305 [Shewanella baltica]
MTILVRHSIDLGAFRQVKRVHALTHRQAYIGNILSIFMFLLVEANIQIITSPMYSRLESVK